MTLLNGSSGVCAVVVSYNSAIPLQLFARAVSKVVPMLVVDNASTDGSADACESWGIDVLRMSANTGYGPAINRGVASLPPQVTYILVLNPDARLDVQAIAALRQRLEDRPEVGVVAPRIRNLDGTEQLAARAFPTIGNQLVRRIAPESIRVRTSSWTPHPDWVLGAALMVRRRDFECLGGFDERFFLYCEDVDLCWRYRQAGFLVEQLEDIWAEHAYERSSTHLGNLTEPAVRHHWRSMAQLARAHPWAFSGVSAGLHRRFYRRFPPAATSQARAT